MLTRTPQPGLPVYTSDDRRIGAVTTVSASGITIARRFRRDLYIPLQQIGLVILGDGKTESRVNLKLASRDLGAYRQQQSSEPITIGRVVEMPR